MNHYTCAICKNDFIDPDATQEDRMAEAEALEGGHLENPSLVCQPCAEKLDPRWKTARETN